MSESQGRKKEQKSEIFKTNEASISENDIPEFMRDSDFENLPPEAKRSVSRMVSMFMSTGPSPHPFISKMDTQQVGKVIDSMENDSRRDHEDRMSSRRWNFAALLVILTFVIILSFGCLWKDKSEYIAPIITALIGGVGGYGIGISRSREE